MVPIKITVNDVISTIKNKFIDKSNQALIPIQRKGYFKAELVSGGIEVDNLGN